ncbi:MAG: DnaJ domain-containing protein [Chloroflexota bacterium]|nr:DnaJ domain-containing protein [Chloroflexota bacterium]
MDIDRDYYAVLGVSTSATQEEIQRAYHRLARRYHPDSREVNIPTTLFHQVQEAYAVLGDARSRRAYDRRREELGLNEEAALSWNVILSRERLPAAHQEQMLYALVEIEPAATSESARLPLNLCLVIDRSTSMKGARLEHVKEAARQIADGLGDEDALGIVAFDDRAEVVLPSQVGVASAHAKARITSLRAAGGTEILQGIRAGLDELDKHHGERVISHLILLTDGRTYGDDEECVAQAERAGARDMGISAMGIGEDWNDVLLDTIASRSGGTSAYIVSPTQVLTLLRNKVRSLGAVFATGLTLEAHTSDGVRVESALLTSPHLKPLSWSGGAAKLGTLEADAPLKVLMEIGVERRPLGTHRLLQLRLNGNVPSMGRRGEMLRRDIRCLFTEEEEDRTASEVPLAVLDALRTVTLYRMQERAWAALDEGQVEQATRQLEMVATRLFDLGQERLAEAAMLEAGRVAREGNPTARGRKAIKYGTRSLRIGEEAHD